LSCLALRRPALNRTCWISASAKDADRSRRRALRVSDAAGWIWAIPILTEFKLISRHVIKTPTVRGISSSDGRNLKKDSAWIVNVAGHGIVFIGPCEIRLLRMQTVS